MNKYYNNKNLKGLRRLLRRSPTDAEKIMWRMLQNKQVKGLKFFRQYSVGNYIIDFYCPAIRLAIEIDGGQHFKNEHDIERTHYLNKKDVFVLKFWNNDVLSNRNGVYERIISTIESLYS